MDLLDFLEDTFIQHHNPTWASLIVQLVKKKKIYLQYRRPQFDSWVGKIHWRRDRLPTPGLLGFPCGSAGKASACNMGDLGSISGLRRSPGERKCSPLQYSGLENSMDYIVHGFSKSQTRLSDFHSESLSLCQSMLCVEIIQSCPAFKL